MAKDTPPAEPAKKGEARDESATPGPERLTPRQWAERLGMVHKADKRLPQSFEHDSLEHAVADQLYGWSRHAYHYQAQADAFLLTEEDYRAALKAAMAHPTVAPHAAAIPESEKARWQGFKPRARKERS